jgi:putative addiction module component (TIGR02574 family)
MDGQAGYLGLRRSRVAKIKKNNTVIDIMSTVEQVEAEIRRLPRKSREQVAERLNAQLWPSGFAPEVESAWADAVKKRLDDLDSGRVLGVPAAQVFARARRILARR